MQQVRYPYFFLLGPDPKGTDTLESFLSKVAFESNLRKKLAIIEHVLIVTVYFERRKIAKVFMTVHVQDFFRKLLSNATFERKLSGVSLPLPYLPKFNQLLWPRSGGCN